MSSLATYILHTCEKVLKKLSSQQKMELTNSSEYEHTYNSNMELGLDLQFTPSPTLVKVRYRWNME